MALDSFFLVLNGPVMTKGIEIVVKVFGRASVFQFHLPFIGFFYEARHNVASKIISK